jgi:hypothetical protein
MMRCSCQINTSLFDFMPLPEQLGTVILKNTLLSSGMRPFYELLHITSFPRPLEHSQIVFARRKRLACEPTYSSAGMRLGVTSLGHGRVFQYGVLPSFTPPPSNQSDSGHEREKVQTTEGEMGILLEDSSSKTAQ